MRSFVLHDGHLFDPFEVTAILRCPVNLDGGGQEIRSLVLIRGNEGRVVTGEPVFVAAKLGIRVRE